MSKAAEGPNEVAVIIPCRDEAGAIGAVVRDFRAALPDARIYVYDNRSTDATARIAAEAGAIVRRESMPGKGHVIRRMFADVEADIYVMVDGDGTYDAASAPRMVDLLQRERLDMVTGRRVSRSKEAYRAGHEFGNRLINRLVGVFFGNRFDDILSGYRVFSRRFVKTFPALATGFEIETELSIHALELNMPLAEVPTDYRERQPGSESKLNTFADGFRVMWTIFLLIRDERPLSFFGVCGLLLLAISVLLAFPVLVTYLDTGLVPRFPTAILSASIALLGFLSIFAGLILDTVTRGRKELKRLFYLREGVVRDTSASAGGAGSAAHPADRPQSH